MWCSRAGSQATLPGVLRDPWVPLPPEQHCRPAKTLAELHTEMSGSRPRVLHGQEALDGGVSGPLCLENVPCWQLPMIDGGSSGSLHGSRGQLVRGGPVLPPASIRAAVGLLPPLLLWSQLDTALKCQCMGVAS